MVAPDDFLLAVDPGNDTGWARFVNGKLTALGSFNTRRHINQWWKLRDRYHMFPFTRVVVEVPRVYPSGGKKQADPNDLIKVAVGAGVAIGAFPGATVTKVHPHTWKGNRPKKVDHRAHAKKLGVKEIAVIEKACPGAHKKMLAQIDIGDFHNVMDAVGIGLWALKRRR